MFSIGDRVNRIEDRPITSATVKEVMNDGQNVLITYDEGGEGWWPSNCLELIV